jgi:hypothetical protein
LIERTEHRTRPHTRARFFRSSKSWWQDEARDGGTPHSHERRARLARRFVNEPESFEKIAGAFAEDPRVILRRGDPDNGIDR